MRVLLFFLVLIGAAAPASAHRLDEYLQATTIDLGRDKLTLRLRLTPGIDVAGSVLAGIDANRDGIISGAEQWAYAEQVRGDLTLALDGRRRTLRLAGISFPAAGELRRGIGEILLDFEATVPSADGTHSMRLNIRHQHAMAVYLINTLMPHDRAIGIVSQDRSYDQSSYRLDYSIGGSTMTPRMSGPASADEWASVRTFFWEGVLHILTGYDHLLFVAALVLGAVTLWDLVKVVTAFTVAHSVTLTLAAFELVHVPGVLIEPVIAGSIVFVAVQNVLRPSASRGNSRLAVAFLFGLFHGLGFAGGLLDLLHGMPDGTFLLAIVGFSLGIEAGNQIVLLPLFGLLQLMRTWPRQRDEQPCFARTLQAVGSSTVAMGGAYYLALALAPALE